MATASTASHSPRWLLRAIVLASSFAVMALELAASRLLTPWFGSSTFVWGTLISVILLALALGYWLGGRAADRYPGWPLLARLLLGAGLWVSAADVAAPWLLGRAAPLGLVAGPLVGMAALMFVPMAALGAMTPVILKLRVDDVARLGEASGAVFVLSTVGSILGTAATTFLFVPLLGTTTTIALLGFLLTLLGVLALPQRSARDLPLPILPLLLAFQPPSLAPPVPGQLFAAESAYEFVRVVEREGHRYLLLNHDRPGLSFNSVRGPGLLSGAYFDDLALAPAMVPGARRVLVVGMGAGTVVSLLHALYPQLTIDAVDIDPVVADVARRYFALPNDPRVHVHVAEGRTFVAQSDARWDVILVDVFQNGPYAPFHVATQEFYQLLADHLTPGGVVVTNVEVVEKPLLNTIASVLPEVLTVRRGGNVLTYASARPLAIPRPGDPALPEPLHPNATHAQNDMQRFHGEAAPVFTDDHAPIELAVALHELLD